MKRFFEDYNNIVIKIGSSIVVDDGKARENWLKSLADEINQLKLFGKKISIVTSGAVAIGRKKLNKNSGKLKLNEKQAAAACGQLELVGAYQKAFSGYKLNCAQILLSLEDSDSRERYLNARGTIETLLDAGVIPVINENDTVATAEIRVGDNDRLAARVAQMISADLLILLSDVDGIYSADPRKDKSAEFIAKVKKIDTKIEKMAGGSGSEVGTGGMITKVMAAKIAINSGCTTIIAKGTENLPLSSLASGAKHTVFTAVSDASSARNSWISSGLKPKGVFTIDAGAEKALAAGKSLLPAGVTAVSGNFSRGDLVVIKSKSGDDIARGLSGYDADETKKIIGRKSSEIITILGYNAGDELVHRNDMVLVK